MNRVEEVVYKNLFIEDLKGRKRLFYFMVSYSVFSLLLRPFLFLFLSLEKDEVGDFGHKKSFN